MGQRLYAGVVLVKRKRCGAAPRTEDDPIFGLSGRGFANPIFPSVSLPQISHTVVTAEAGLAPDPSFDMRAEPLVQEGDEVLQGQPVFRDRRRPHRVVTASMAGQVADLRLGPGRRLESLVLYGGQNQARYRYEIAAAHAEVATGKGEGALSALLQAAGLWMRFRSRPFGHVPDGEARPESVFVMAVDTRPLAPDPRLAIKGPSQAHLDLGLRALACLTDGPLHVCQDRGPDIVQSSNRVKIEKVSRVHPAGSAGFCAQRIMAPRPERPVWEIDVEDVAAVGHLLAEGMLSTTRLVSLTGPGMREPRLVRCQPGADLRELCYAHMLPGPTAIFSGSMLGGRESRWLGFRDRQVTVINRPEPRPTRNWLGAALVRASRPAPVIPTAALEHAMGDYVPALPLLRALSIGDDEAVMELGGLSLLEEDLALADYVTAASPRFSDLLRASLDRIEASL